MPYHIDAEKVSLEDLRKRIEETDLVPSRRSLLDGIKTKFQILEQHGFTTLALLRNKLKNPKQLESLSSLTGIEKQYLVLLRREINSYFPKPITLKKFDWLVLEEIEKLEQNGIRNSAAFFEMAGCDRSRTELAETSGNYVGFLSTLFRFTDLTRVQWVSPTAARMLVKAGYDSVSKLASADDEELHQALLRVNEGDRFFKGNVGQRDVKRLIRSARYVQYWTET